MHIHITGRAAVLTSISFDILEKLARFRPSALVMRNDAEEPIFKISVRESRYGDLNKFGVTFNDQTAAGDASLTFLIPAEVEDKRQYVEDNYAIALWKLQVMEAHILSEYNALQESLARIADSISSD